MSSSTMIFAANGLLPSRLCWAAGVLLAAAAAALSMKRRPKKALIDEEDDCNIVKEKLLDVEIGLYNRDEPPVTTLTWFRGDYQKARQILEQRLQKILEKNPWLTGRVVKTGVQLHLIYNRNNQREGGDFGVALYDNSCSISRNTPLDQLARRCQSAMLKNGPTQPLLKVSLIPCRNNPHEHFALVLAISHLVADGHTFYRIQSMLCSNDESTIVSLTCKRTTTTGAQQSAAMGKQNYDYFAIPGWGFMLNSLYGFWRGKTIGPCNQSLFARVDTQQMAIEKEKQKGSTVPFVSTNDVLTSWFLQNSGCSLGVMSINWRNRLDGHTDDHAGNYESGIFYRPFDSASPGLIRQSLLSRPICRILTSNDRLPATYEMATATTLAIVTNWASFAQPNEIINCQEELHIPLYDAAPVVPTTFALLIIFRAGPDGQMGLHMVGTPEKLQGLRNAPFFSDEPLVE